MVIVSRNSDRTGDVSLKLGLQRPQLENPPTSSRTLGNERRCADNNHQQFPNRRYFLDRERNRYRYTRVQPPEICNNHIPRKPGVKGKRDVTFFFVCPFVFFRPVY